jgi:hypothetical protein
MKKLFSLINLIIVSQLTIAQSLILVPTNPDSPAKGTILFDNILNQLKYWDGTNYIPITNAASGTGWALGGTDIYNSNAGRVLVGASSFASSAKFNVITSSGNYGLLHSGTNGISIASYVGSSSAFWGTTSNYPFTLMANNGTQLTILPNGNIGVGNTAPINKLEVGSVGSTGYGGNHFAFGNGTNATAFYQSNSSVQIGTTKDLTILPRQFSGGQGYVGINTPTPTNKLQIGSVGNTGFSTNDFALGNGTEAFAIYQTNTETQLGASKNIILTPAYSNGRVGINTLTPRAPLDVATKANVLPALNSFYTDINEFSYGASDIGFKRYESSSGTYVPNVSIVTSGSIYAFTFDVYSDSRIKNVTGVSNSANDLETINALKITDYTMKDRLAYGNKPFKKVIAQEVEKVYPQVISKHRDFIPNVYQACSGAEKTAEGYVLRFNKPHQISKTAKRLQLLADDNKGMEQVSIVRIPSDNTVVVYTAEIKGQQCFVYGEEVDDFRTVDYEGLTTLNISATQELSKLVKDLQNENTTLKSKNEDMQKQIADLKSQLNKIEALLSSRTDQ